jgi:hypothetical protein
MPLITPGEARGRMVDEWKAKPGKRETITNLDCLVGCCVAGSSQGAVLFGTDQKAGPKRARIRLSAMQRRRR